MVTSCCRRAVPRAVMVRVRHCIKDARNSVHDDGFLAAQATAYSTTSRSLGTCVGSWSRVISSRRKQKAKHPGLVYHVRVPQLFSSAIVAFRYPRPTTHPPKEHGPDLSPRSHGATFRVPIFGVPWPGRRRAVSGLEGWEEVAVRMVSVGRFCITTTLLHVCALAPSRRSV